MKNLPSNASSLYEYAKAKALSSKLNTPVRSAVRWLLKSVPVWRTGSATFNNVTAQNEELLSSFGKCFKLPMWENRFTRWIEEPTHTNRLSSWEEVRVAFGLRADSVETVKMLHKKSNGSGFLPIRCFNEVVAQKNRARVLYQLERNEIVQRVKEDTLLLNPSILWARDWYSPFAQGVMATNWMNRTAVELPHTSRMSLATTAYISNGARHASNML